MKYYVWYEDENHLHGKEIPYGELTWFKKMAKINRWNIRQIEKVSKDRKVKVVFRNQDN